MSPLDQPVGFGLVALGLGMALVVALVIGVQEYRRLRYVQALKTWERLYLMDAIIDGRRTMVVRPKSPAKPVRKTGLPFSPYNRRSA